MALTKEKYRAFAEVLQSELIPAMGCTEPIAIAYLCAKARDVLGAFPESCEISVSGNIIKNAKSVVVPHTGGMRGIEAAAIAGIVAGDGSARLEVLSRITKEDIEKMREVHTTLPTKVTLADSELAFDIKTVQRPNHHAT